MKIIEQHHPDLSIGIWEEKSGQHEYIIINSCARVAVEKSKIPELIGALDEYIKREPTAFEFHNFKTGHCYVDYVERADMTEKEGYTKIPLYKKDNGK